MRERDDFSNSISSAYIPSVSDQTVPFTGLEPIASTY